MYVLNEVAERHSWPTGGGEGRPITHSWAGILLQRFVFQKNAGQRSAWLIGHRDPGSGLGKFPGEIQRIGLADFDLLNRPNQGLRGGLLRAIKEDDQVACGSA